MIVLILDVTKFLYHDNFFLHEGFMLIFSSSNQADFNKSLTY